MKKTIFITLAMLIVFGGAVIFGAGKVSDQWQTPQKDKFELSANSPIEKVETEYKAIQDFNFTVRESSQHKEDMISFEEAAYIGGTYLEEIFTYDTFSDKQFVLFVDNKVTPHHKSTPAIIGFYELKKSESFMQEYYTYAIDAYSGEILEIRQFSAEPKWEKDYTEEQAVKYAIEVANILGYGELQKYSFKSGHYVTDATTYAVNIMIDDSNGITICFNSIGDTFFLNMDDEKSAYLTNVKETGIEFVQEG